MAKITILGVIFCALGMVGSVCAEPMGGKFIEQMTIDSATTDDMAEYAEGLVTKSSDGETEKRAKAAANSTQELAVRDAQSFLVSNMRPEWPLSQRGIRHIEPAVPSVITARSGDEWAWDAELKEAVRPLYEELKSSGVPDVIRSLKSEVAPSRITSFVESTLDDYTKKPVNSEPHDAASWEDFGNRSAPHMLNRSVAQVEKEKIMHGIMIDDFVETLKSWLFGLAALYVLGCTIKLSFDYLRWNAERVKKRHTSMARGHRHGRGVHRKR